MFITFEGPDGSGKTTQIPMIESYLRSKGVDLLVTREPGGTVIGNQVRNVLFDLSHKDIMHPRTEILLFQSSRAQLVEEVIKPALNQGRTVLCDRYADSTLAYQGYGHRINMQQLKAIVNFATGGLVPDLTIYFDIPAEIGLRRRAEDGDWNRLDAYAIEFHNRVRNGYHELMQNSPQSWEMVDASLPINQVNEEVIRLLKAHNVFT
ncbi:MAG: dTMP kinase [Anaerolineales bacterium]|nr:dTMP kinase [Anaerolineales bacterium]